jgi:hypothetical protein
MTSQLKASKNMTTFFRQTIALLIAALLFTPCTKGQEISITRLNINNATSSEIAPLVLDSTLYFISNRKSSVLVNIFTQDNQHLYKLYSAPLNPDGSVGKVSLFELTADQPLSSGPITFSPDGALLITTLNQTKDLKAARNTGAENQLSLYQSHKRRDNWQPLEAIPFNIGAYSLTHPSISPDASMLFFVSNMPGGFGETDLYVSRRTGTGWGSPVNLGETINTAGSELFPYFHPSGKLYFTSDGHGGMGGMDIFYTIHNNHQWSPPIALEAPINSDSDDFSSFIFSDEGSGFFASNRDGGDNLYQFKYELAFCEQGSEVSEDNYCFTFFEESELDKDSVPHQYRWEFSDGGQARGDQVDHCFPGPGFYEIFLHVIDSISGEELFAVANYELLLEETKQVYFSAPDTLQAGEDLSLEAKLMGHGEMEGVQYFWDLGEEEEIRLGKTIQHNFRKRGTYIIKCEAYWDGNQLCSYRTIVVE